MGAAVAMAVKGKTDCELAYRSCEWVNGALVFSDVVLFDPSFHVHMETVCISFDWSAFPTKFKGHIDIDSPQLAIKKSRPLPAQETKWFEFSVSIREGKLDWGGAVSFSLEHDTTHSELTLDWKNASAHLFLQDQKVNATLHSFKLPLLQPWIPYVEVLEGTATGRLSISLDGKPLSTHLKIEDGALQYCDGSMQGVGGTISYNANLGAKWDFKGFGKSKRDLFPFFCSGRGFFKNYWLQSEIRFDESYCKIFGDVNQIGLECESICACEASWLQAALATVFPECKTVSFENGLVSGSGSLGSGSWNVDFEASHLKVKKGSQAFSCDKMSANLTQDGGSCIILDDAYELKFAGMWEDWNAEARIQDAEMTLHGGWDGEKIIAEIDKGSVFDLEFKGKGWLNSRLQASFFIEGTWNLLQKKIPFYCPILTFEEGKWNFDFRLKRKTWDFFRIAGAFDGHNLTYLPTSHLLGQPLSTTAGTLKEIDISVELPWKAILAGSPILKEWNLDLKKIPVVDHTCLHFQYQKDQIDLVAKGDSLPFSLHAHQNQDDWQIDLCCARLSSELTLAALLKKDGSLKGALKWENDFETNFEGKLDSNFCCEFSLSNSIFNLKTIDALKMEGMARGSGHFIYNGEIEADFDFNVSSLSIESYPLENEEQIHFSYTSKQGALFQGVHLHGPFDCVVDLLEYDAKGSHWIFHNAQIHLPTNLLTHKFLQFIDKDQTLNLNADIDLASDFSSVSCSMREGSIPFNGAYRHIEGLEFLWKGGKCEINLHYLNQLYRMHCQIDDKIAGRFILGDEEMPLAIDWQYQDKLLIQSIEGAFHGIEASFHAESPNTLVGSAHINFTAISPLLPVGVAEVFEEIKMGQGYELKGRLKLKKNRPYFQGILSGKAIELFGFQFRTLLAQVDLGPETLRIYDMKISDSAGIMKIDEILMEDRAPWTIAIPNLTILDLRPSLLMRPGDTAPGSLTPLVVRELNIKEFKGILDDGKTYTATGQLHFINSYKREETVFDLPANVLSRIVGLDLDLLVPVKGDLIFDIKDGFFNLLELKNAYSEGKRSQFFLETDLSPRMDLDGNLQICIKMKQFVLFKITESLLISIDGALVDPQFHLKRKRFFGLM